LGEEELQISLPEPVRVDEIRVGDDGDPTPADRAARDKLSLSPAIPCECVERSGRRRSHFLIACTHRLRIQPCRGSEAQPPMSEQSRIGEARGRAEWVAERPVARPLKGGIGQQQHLSSAANP
jgi:hypothetical protein